MKFRSHEILVDSVSLFMSSMHALFPTRAPKPRPASPEAPNASQLFPEVSYAS